MMNVRKGLLGLLVAATATAGLAQPGGAQDALRTCKGHVETGTATVLLDLADLTEEERRLWYHEWMDDRLIDPADGNYPLDNPGLVIGAGGDGADVIIGTPRNDVILGSGPGDIVCSLGGDDAFLAAGGSAIYMGPGDDLFVRSDADRVHGGPGNDFISVDFSDTIVRAGMGDDTVRVFGKDSVVRGGLGNDDLRNHASGHGNRIYGGPGFDLLWNHAEHATLLGGLGPDHLLNVRAQGDDVRVILRGGGGDDVIGDDGFVMRGGPGEDACAGRFCEMTIEELPDDRKVEFVPGTAWWSD